MGIEKSLSSEGLKDLNEIFNCEVNLDRKEYFPNTYIQSIPKNNTPVYKLFKQNDYDVLKEHFKDMDVYFKGQKFNNTSEFIEYLIRLKSINMIELLELPKLKLDDEESKVVIDVLYPMDENNLAKTYRSDKEGIEYYKCLADNIQYQGHIVSVIGKLINKNQYNTSQILLDLFGIKIEEPNEIKEIRTYACNFVDSLRSGELKLDMPNFHKVFGSELELLCCLIEKVSSQDYYKNEKSNTFRILSYMSLKSYRDYYKENYSGYHKSDYTIMNKIQSMTLAGILIKVKLLDLPQDLRNMLEKSRKSNKYKYHTDVISIPLFNNEYLIKLEEKCRLLVSKNFKKSSLSKDMVIATYGIDEAVKVFSQIKDVEMSLSNKLARMKLSAENIITIQIAKSGYITETFLIDRLYRNRYKSTKGEINFTRKTIKKELKQINQVILEENELTCSKLTKKLRSELNVSEEDIPLKKQPLIYYLN